MTATLTAKGRQTLREAVARAIRARIRDGSTVAKEAARCGVAPFTVQRWVSGEVYPAFTVALRIAPLYGVAPATGKANA